MPASRILSLLGLFWSLTSSLCSSPALATQPKRPHILIAISDDQSWPDMSAYDSSGVDTPGFDRVAQSGALFTNGFAASPGCSPSRAALLTGRHTWQIEEAGTHASSFPQKFTTFPELLQSQGYHIGYTGKGWGPGNWKISGRDNNPAGPVYSKQKTPNVPEGISSVDYAANFEEFLQEKNDDQPFLFWFGAIEPHRPYKKGLGLEQGKTLDQARVPGYLPDHPEIRSDILDYYAEIEWFDKHLLQMITLLEERGELKNTFIIVTADNGAPFPRAKANCYEAGIHVPLAISWPAQIPAKQTVNSLCGFVDLTATIAEAAQIPTEAFDGPLSGRSYLSYLKQPTEKSAQSLPTAAFAARERHSSSRYNNWTYPQRALRTPEFLLIRNFRPERWPAGAPQKYEEPGVLGPLHAAYHDIDACPSLTFLVENREDPAIAPYFHAAIDKRPEYELFEIQKDPACLHNLMEKPQYQPVFEELKSQLENYLRETGDPRILNGGEVYETYRRYSRVRSFPKPDSSPVEEPDSAADSAIEK